MLTRIRPLGRLGQESGQSLVTGIIVLMVVMMLGVVALQTSNVQTRQSGLERSGENAFNLAESALEAEVSLLESSWPSSASTAYPVCTQSSTATATCPQGSIAGGFNTTYAGSGFASPAWSVQVVDDNVTGVADAGYYSDSILASAQLAHYDANADNKLWVRASATIRGRTRSVVAEVARQTVPVWLPQNVLTSGGVQTSNNGNKVIISASDSSSGLTGTVDLRCGSANPPTTPSYGSYCAGWSQRHGQLSPASAYQTAYTDPLTSYQTLTNATIDSLRQTAESNNTYYQGTCPALGTPGVLFIENTPPGGCTYNGTGSGVFQWNSDASPGAIVVANGTLTIGAVNFYGIIYMADGQATAPGTTTCAATQQNRVLTVQGGGTVHGGVFIDRCGTASVGDAGFDLQYDTKAFGGLHTYATPSMALSTFRVLSNS